MNACLFPPSEFLTPAQFDDFGNVLFRDAMRETDTSRMRATIAREKHPITAADAGKIAEEMLERAERDARSSLADARWEINAIREIRASGESRLWLHNGWGSTYFDIPHCLRELRRARRDHTDAVRRVRIWREAVAENPSYERAVSAHWRGLAAA